LGAGVCSKAEGETREKDYADGKVPQKTHEENDGDVMSEKYRLVRDTLGFYSQVPIEDPLALEEEIAVEKAAEDIVADIVADISPPKRRAGRPKSKLNAEFEVDV
jgi:hypothetical protein